MDTTNRDRPGRRPASGSPARWVARAAAAPLYWLFVDLASPVSALFFAASVALLAGNLVRAGARHRGRVARGAGERPSVVFRPKRGRTRTFCAVPRYVPP